ncbi:sodium:proton antiporter [Salinisphaera sp. Q1T1-3]|uniref:cation:proton antiporter n=1 Tax=Salinisphaera sp. Q1T1-3 TaxID=2321229 RepID=UPI000E72AE3B|nr:sodium:proton antiporter [Salinisphaera sp. Q1T1-3]RJS91445.1 sodium:proton antiporter [Salinisphaera sp. Q1T1-3]
MTLFQLTGLLLALTALFAWLNRRLIGLPATIGVMLLALVLSLIAQALVPLGVDVAGPAGELVAAVDFNHTLLDGMLGALLFAGAMQVDVRALLKERWVVGILATVGLAISTLIVGTLTWGMFYLLDASISPMYCYVFGAIVSPTDPIAVLAILRRAGVPKTLETQFTGESLFNDAVAIVAFLALSEAADPGTATGLSAGHILTLFSTEALGGIAFGIALGGIGFGLLRGIDDYKTEVLVTLALVIGGYAAADAIHVSGPLAIVSAGLLVGHHGRGLAMSDRTREHVDTFWELIDEILNAVLFVIIGLEVLHISFSQNAIIVGLAAIPILLVARFVAVGLPIIALKSRRDFAPHTIKILTWGGLRGGISVALALSLPEGHARDLIVNMTYIAVIFSICVQGLTIGRVARLAVTDSDEKTA